MRGTVAKRIRKNIYGDQTLKTTRKYSNFGGTLVNIGLRQEYLDAKRDYVNDKR
jgi:hypothetical protein